VLAVVVEERPTIPTNTLEHLEVVLQSPSFVSSRRCQDFLRYVIREFVEGRADSIKERTIALEVFGKSPRFDPGSDSLVRVKAREVRKRLTEYYESASDAPLRIELPVGSYVPIIRVTESASGNDLPEIELSLAPDDVEQLEGAPEEVRKASPKFIIFLTTALAIALMAVVWSISRRPHAENNALTVWSPLLDNPNTVLISTGRPVTSPAEELEPPNLSIKEHFGRPDFRVSLTTADAIANVAGFLQQQKKPFRIHDAASNTLSDLHGRPVVLVNGNDNRWTLLLLQPTRFTFVSQGGLSYIQDSKNPGRHDWNVDFSQPFHKQTTDYAIVGQFNSATTGGPIIVAAGISSNGTEAAGEFIVSPERLSELLRSAPTGWKNGNFEAVLKVEVIDGSTGASSIIASEFW
jgi:hypothetical protein